MATANDYINPIIQAMMATVENQRKIAAQKLDAEQLQETIRGHKATELHNDTTLKTLEKHNQDLHDIELQRLDMERKRQEAQAMSDKIMRTLAINKAVREGDIKIPTKHEGVPGVMGRDVKQPINIGGITLDPETMSSPEEAGAQKIREAAGIAGAQRNAQFGYMQDVNQLPPSRTDIFKQEGAERVAGMNIAGRQDTTETKADADYKRALAVAMLHAANSGTNLDENTAHQYVQGVFVNGKMKLNQIPLKQRGGVLAAAKELGYEAPLDPKDNEIIDGIPIMQQFISKARELAQKGSSWTGAGKAVTGFGDVGSLKQEVDGLLGNIARVYGGEKGVLTQRDIERGAGLVYSPKANLKENLKKVADLEKAFKAKIGPVLKNYKPAQRQAILEGRGINFDVGDSESAAPTSYKYKAIGPNQHQIGSNDGSTWFDLQTGKAVQ